MQKHNFSAGPSILPKSVFEKASQAILDYNSKGLSLLEMSHRSDDFVQIMHNAQSLVKELLGLNENQKVLFLSGGASTAFYILALNLLKTKAAYVNTGTWSTKAIKEAKRIGHVDTLASSEDQGFNYIPEFEYVENCDYLHTTSNNTIYGTQYQNFKSYKSIHVCDMSSDIFSRTFNAQDFGLIYAGAQKNMGPAGTTLYIVNQEILGKTQRNLPSMLDLELQIQKNSMFNTPPVFPIYVSMLTLEWITSLGGVQQIEKINNQKSDLLYNEIDRNALLVGYAQKESRSKMNVTFNLTDKQLSEAFLEMCSSAGIVGIKGHRSVGGFRASIYNAMPIESVQVLVDVMQDFEKQYG